MRKYIFRILLVIFFTQSASAQKDSWEQIDNRPIPQWWKDAKFGIFIHWGPYSVPAFSKVGEYSEWYWKDLVDTTRVSHKTVREFHDTNYGAGFTYPDFIPSFTCEFFDPDQWAKIFQDAGAKYVVVTSKHHDGYTLWDSKEATNSWGRPWSSTNTGPQRDLLGDLTRAVRKTSVKMGIYYSLYEWFNPLYNADVDLFVKQHLFPQFKDVVQKYKPSIIFSDGEWEHPDSVWHSPELLSWLYNESASSKEDVVVNDRWGKDTRHEHGGYYTTEYGSGLNTDKPWEENRGMAHSFGYSRTENLEDYNSSRELVYMLIDIVSRGGNFLLDIGPTADGRIPVIMQERLADIGNWLKVNGEAIYGTSALENSCQWSKGKVRDADRGRYKIKYDIMELTINPKEGYAVKEIFFTRKNKNLYAISPTYPDEKLHIKNISLEKNAKVTFLGTNQSLKWEKKGMGIEIMVPSMNLSKVPFNYAYTFKIEGVDYK